MMVVSMMTHPNIVLVVDLVSSLGLVVEDGVVVVVVACDDSSIGAAAVLRLITV